MSVEIVRVEHGGVPAGGTTGQRLVKTGAGDAAVGWQDVVAGFSTGQILLAPDSATSQTGYLKCDGSNYLRASYPALAAEIGAPSVLSNANTIYTNSGLKPGYIYSAGSYVFMNGTVTATSNTATSAALYTSTDGTTWQSRTAHNILDVGPNTAVVTNGTGTYVLAKTTGISYTTTLTSWVSVTTGAPGKVRELAYGPSVFVAVGNDDLDTPQLSYSATGTTWSSVASGTHGFTGTSIVSVAASSSLFIAVGSLGLVRSSSNGSTWSTVATGVFGTPARVSYVNSLFIITTQTGRVYTSPDGTTWTFVSQLPIVDCAKVYHNGTFYVARSVNDGGFCASLDLVNWITYNTGSPTCSMGTKFWIKVGTIVQYRDNTGYDVTTEFPVPNISFANASLVASGNYKTMRGWIKT